MTALPTAIAAASGVAKSKVKELRLSAELIAATLALALHVGPIYACMIMAALSFGIALVLMMVRRSKKRSAENSQHVDPAAALVSTLAKSTDSVSPVGMSMMALAAGYALSKK